MLVPQLVRARTEHPDGGLAHEQRLLTLILCVLGAGTVLAVLAAPEIASLYISDNPAHHGAYALTVVFCRFLPYGKLVLAAGGAAGAAWATAAYAIPVRFGPLVALPAGGAAMALLFLALARALRLPELRMLPGLRSRPAGLSG